MVVDFVSLYTSLKILQSGLSPSYVHGLYKQLITVNLEIFSWLLFSRNFAKFREKQILTKWRDHSVVN